MIAVGPLQKLGSVFQGKSRTEQYRAELTEPTELGSARSSTAVEVIPKRATRLNILNIA